MRGGIAERGGVRVGHRIIEINGQSVVATPHDKIVHILSNAVGEVRKRLDGGRSGDPPMAHVETRLLCQEEQRQMSLNFKGWL